MALMPKRVKHRKSQRGRIKGEATRGNRVVFGEYGLQATQGGWLSAQTIDAARLDRLGAQPAALLGLQTEFAEGDAVRAGRVTSYTPSLAFSVLDPLGHQRHRSRPQTCLG